MRFKALILSTVLSVTLIFNSVQTAYATEPSTEGSTEAATEAASESPTKAPSSSNGLWPAGPEVHAGSAILIDADTGTVLYEKNSHAKAYPASTTKLMTALLALEKCSLTETVTFSYEAVHSVSPGDSYIATKDGEQYSMEQCLYALMLPSANEVAYGVGEHISGSISSFVSLMNQRARELGATDTHFNNASGLYDPEHYTTAYDLAMIGRACMQNTTLISIMKTLSYQIPPTNKTNETRYLNQRHLLLKQGKYYYEYCVGGKTGFTDESQYTLVSFATKGDLNLICVVFQCEQEEYRYEDTITLMNWGFSNFERVSVSSEDAGVLLNNTNFYKSEVFGAPETTFSLETSYITLPDNADKNKVITSISRENSGNAFAVVTFSYDGKKVGTADLIVVFSSEYTEDQPSNLPFIKKEQTNTHSATEYVVINAWYIIYTLAAILILLIVLFVLIFVNYSPRGREMMRTRKRRKGYRRGRKLRF